MRHATKNRTVICSVVFLDVVEYSQMTVQRQARIKSVLNTIVAAGLEQIAEDDRYVLDTGDGAALCFVGDPEDALFTAIDVLAEFHGADFEDDPAPGLRVGINLGPVRVAEDLTGGMNLIGDGINVAQRIMSFSEPNQILVSRSYFEVVSCLSTRHAALFRYHGLHKDKHVREHVVYQVQVAGSAEQSADAAEAVRPLEIAPERIVEIQDYLVHVIGPLGAILVPRAAARSPTEQTFVETLALAVPEGPERSRFLTSFTPAERSAEEGHTPVPQGNGAAPEQTYTQAQLDAVTAALAKEMGPLAKMLTARAATHQSSLEEIITELGSLIADQNHRNSFIDEAHALVRKV